MPRTTLAPPITRVHKLFRIRTVVNDSSTYGGKVTTREVGRILVDRGLSKKSILESMNKLKRARDHAHNASYLGFFTPIPENGRQFSYVVSPIGRLLSKYTFDDECPRDLHEAAIFVDRMMRLKLTNSYDSMRTYARFHTRPFLSVLSVLRHQTVHLEQIHWLLSVKNDLASNPKLTTNALANLSKYPSIDEDAIKRFAHDHKLTGQLARKEIYRSTKPLVEWCQQSGILTVDSDGWCRITEHGIIAHNMYSVRTPLWYDRLGFNGPVQSALLVLYPYASAAGKRIDRSKLGTDAGDALDDLQRRYNILDSGLRRLRVDVDFDFHYDVPVELREEVRQHIESISKEVGIPTPDLDKLPTYSINSLEDELRLTSHERRHLQLGAAFGIEIPRRECFQTDFEWQTCIRLRVLQFPANPYQGEFEGLTDLPMASDNPDIILRNDIRTLVECKTRSE